MPRLEDFLSETTQVKKNKSFGLQDEFDKDPRRYCPDCDSVKISNKTPRHAIDFEIYSCNNCMLSYELNYQPNY